MPDSFSSSSRCKFFQFPSSALFSSSKFSRHITDRPLGFADSPFLIVRRCPIHVLVPIMLLIRIIRAIMATALFAPLLWNSIHYTIILSPCVVSWVYMTWLCRGWKSLLILFHVANAGWWGIVVGLRIVTVSFVLILDGTNMVNLAGFVCHNQNIILSLFRQ